MALLSEFIEQPPPSPEDPVPAGETRAAWTRSTVLTQARALASALDPPRASTYRSMSSLRWQQAVDLGADLLVEHAGYRLHNTRGRGRRQHAAEIHAALDATNSANLVAAVAVMLVMGRILDGSTRGTS
jgi:hypothetical protein